MSQSSSPHRTSARNCLTMAFFFGPRQTTDSRDDERRNPIDMHARTPPDREVVTESLVRDSLCEHRAGGIWNEYAACRTLQNFWQPRRRAAQVSEEGGRAGTHRRRLHLFVFGSVSTIAGSVVLAGQDAVLASVVDCLGGVEVDGDPAVIAREDVPAFHAEHAGQAGPGQVDIEESDPERRVVGEEGEGELDRDGRFADAAFAGEDEEDVLDVTQSADERCIGVHRVLASQQSVPKYEAD